MIFTVREGQGCACPWACAPSAAHARIAETANSLRRTISKALQQEEGLTSLPHDTGGRYRATVSPRQQAKPLHRSRDQSAQHDRAPEVLELKWIWVNRSW